MSSIRFPWRDCFASTAGTKATPSEWVLIRLIHNWDKSADLDGRVTAINWQTYLTRSISDKIISQMFRNCHACRSADFFVEIEQVLLINIHEKTI